LKPTLQMKSSSRREERATPETEAGGFQSEGMNRISLATKAFVDQPAIIGHSDRQAALGCHTATADDWRSPMMNSVNAVIQAVDPTTLARSCLSKI